VRGVPLRQRGGALITIDEFVERLCLVGADRGPRGFPRSRRDREILMKSIVLLLDGTRAFTEPEINAALLAWNRDVAPAVETDHVTLRRLLVDYGHLERTADGRRYRVGFPSAAVAFDLAVYDLDVRATVAAYRQRVKEERASKQRARKAPPRR
jgi:hypothetical protein